MIAYIRQKFNAAFSEKTHQNYLAALNTSFPNALDFTVAETPIFIDKAFTEKILATGDYVNQVIQSDRFNSITEPSLKNVPFFPKETPLPACIVMDFAIAINDQNELVPALIELQGFPSLFAYEILQDDCIHKTYTIPAGFSPYLNGYTKEKYVAHLETILKGDTLIDTKKNLDTNNQNVSDSTKDTIKHSNKHTVLLEILPHQQKTRIDFYCTEKYFNIPIVCITEIFVEETHLYYERDGKKIKIDRIYNRIVLDELKNQTKEIQEKGALLQTNLNIEWVTHPHHFFKISKFLLPFLKHAYIPKTQFVDQLTELPTALEKYILKPLFSFAGQGVIIDINSGDIENIEGPSGWILQEKVNYANCIETPTGPAKAELRLFYFWDEGKQEYIATMNLARLSKGKMIGVDYNKNKQWVGGSLAYFEKF
ncbi:MAG: hypothetical protein D4R91_04640 [Sediminibacterium sp.]|jgi:hypothetical protein|nr:MAG: hypothetical protein D4R91_04640 [Sediminibacterium sp.]